MAPQNRITNTNPISIKIRVAFAQLALLTGVPALKAQTNNIIKFKRNTHQDHRNDPITDCNDRLIPGGLQFLIFHEFFLGSYIYLYVVNILLNSYNGSEVKSDCYRRCN